MAVEGLGACVVTAEIKISAADTRYFIAFIDEIIECVRRRILTPATGSIVVEVTI